MVKVSTLTPELEREIIAIRCQIRRDEVKRDYVTCRKCGFYRPAAPVQQKICLECYGAVLAGAVAASEASMSRPSGRGGNAVGVVVIAMFSMGMGIILGIVSVWLWNQW